MEPISAPVLKKLKLAQAISEEAASVRNLLPPEPGWDEVASDAKSLASYLENLLKSGFRPSPQVEVAARKPGHGIRPVPYWGVLERVAYRAITKAVMANHPPLDRSAKAYLSFVTAPGLYGRERQAERPDRHELLSLLFFGDSPVKYVVKGDITAFYQFIDHAILADELLLAGADVELIQALVALLGEVQGRSYGLPQLLDASDMLSDLYADRIERDLLRSGFAAWRFNDDFRIACDSYESALTAIEALDSAARRVGLVLAENKTVTVGFDRYVMDVWGLETSEVGESIALDEVEDLVGDYTDDFGADDADSAVSVIQRAQVRRKDVPSGDKDHWIKLRELRGEDIRLLRRALNGLVAASDPRAVDDVLRLAIYAPSLTPSLMRYLTTVAGAEGATTEVQSSVAEVVDKLATDVALNAWQHLWLIDVLRDLGLLRSGVEGATVRCDWVDSLRRDSPNPALQAVAARALAEAERLPLTELVGSAERQSPALLHVYAAAGRVAVQRSDVAKTDEQVITAWAGTSKLHGLLLGVS